MTTITIRQHPNSSTQASLSFQPGGTYEISIQSPYTAAEEQHLEWYFEEYLKFPFTEQIKFQKAGASIAEYGENLFEQVFGQRKAYADLQNAMQGPVNIEIIGDTAFHALHWESLKDPDSATPMAVHASLTRQPLNLQSAPAITNPVATPILRVLLVTSRPHGKHDVAYRTISQPLLAAVRNSQLPVQIDLLRPATYEALIKHLEDKEPGFYHVLHFDVHGAVLDYASLQNGVAAGQFLFNVRYGTTDLQAYEGEKAFLFLDGENDQTHAVVADDLTALLARHGIPVVVLNACQSAKQRNEQETSLGSLLMQAGIQGVVAMAYSVTVSAAALYVKTLYEQLLQCQDFNAAARRARFELFQDKQRQAYHGQSIALEDWLLPVFYQQQPINLALRAFYAEEEAEWLEQAALQYQPPHTTYGFVGRDLEVLEIEKCLQQHNILLIQGMGGAGKTTLLQHLMNWWQLTHFVEQVFYFGYDSKAYTRAQILDAIARQLLSETDYLHRFQPLAEAAQQVMIVQILRATPHCLVLDNLESVTGQTLAIPHSLDASQQADLQRFIQALAGGKTVVLLGSRGPEAWLHNSTDPYQLTGLDAEAASILADKILQRHAALHYREGEQQSDLMTLLTLLAGFPLALEVMLANLKQQTPAQVLKALQQGDAKFDHDSADKTRSIVACIDYSHSALSVNAQSLLLCLAPFKGVLYQPLLEAYSEKLRAQPVFAELVFADWPAVIEEAKNWGLLNTHEVDGFLLLQPTLSYFLTYRLQQDKVRLQAIETAFREVYGGCGAQLRRLMDSKDAQEQQIGRRVTQLEYANLHLALQLCLNAQASIIQPYKALSVYLDSRQAQQQGLKLAMQVLNSLEKYPDTLLQGLLGAELVEILDSVASRQLAINKYPEAEQSYQQALNAWQTNKSVAEKTIKRYSASIYHQLGIVAGEQRQWLQAEDYYQKSLAISIEFADRYKQAATYHQLGSVAQAQRRWLQAEGYYQEALAINIEFTDRYAQANNYHHLGSVAEKQRQWTPAEVYYQKALAIKIEFADRYGQASTYHQLGIVADKQRQWSQAEDYYQEALVIKIEFDDRCGQASTYHQLGRVAEGQRQWLQAEDYYQKSLAIKIEFDTRYEQAGTYHQLGIVAEGQRQWPQAEAYYQKALAIYIEFADRYGQASTYGQFGLLAEQQENWQQALEYLLKALQVFVDFQDEHSRDIALRNLQRVYQSQQTAQKSIADELDNSVIEQVARILKLSVADAEALFLE
ncbi:MAG: hypothetical protein methR_P3618 [Methyloprofundus sp.]|nr:MAG: hypothetical protein methR_P3618 [Methyloprofundus sp.]